MDLNELARLVTLRKCGMKLAEILENIAANEEAWRNNKEGAQEFAKSFLWHHAMEINDGVGKLVEALEKLAWRSKSDAELQELSELDVGCGGDNYGDHFSNGSSRADAYTAKTARAALRAAGFGGDDDK